LDEFAGLWDEKYPMISKSWRSRWTELVPFLVYTTNAIESLHYSIRKVRITEWSQALNYLAIKFEGRVPV
jgi:transposase-like protein